MTSRATVDDDEKLRLFLAVEVPDDVSEALAAWAARHLRGLRGVARHHVTLAFLGPRPARELDAVVAALREATSRVRAGPLGIAGYRETRSVSMLVLSDSRGWATELANDLHTRLEELGVYRREARPWLPHVTVARFRERPRLAPPVPEIGAFTPSAAAAFLSRLHPSGARYEVLESCPLSHTNQESESREG